MLGDYLPIVLLLAISTAFVAFSLAASTLIAPRRPNPAKLAAYECGIEPIRLPRSERYAVKFYVVAMLFIIFDIETIFLFPWAVAFRQLGLFGLIEMGVFILLVFVAYAYVWRSGGLDWESTERGVKPAIAAAREAAAARRSLRNREREEVGGRAG